MWNVYTHSLGSMNDSCFDILIWSFPNTIIQTILCQLLKTAFNSIPKYVILFPIPKQSKIMLDVVWKQLLTAMSNWFDPECWKQEQRPCKAQLTSVSAAFQSKIKIPSSSTTAFSYTTSLLSTIVFHMNVALGGTIWRFNQWLNFPRKWFDSIFDSKENCQNSIQKIIQ